MRRALSILFAAFFLTGCGTYAASPFTPTHTPSSTPTASATPTATASLTPTLTATFTSTPTFTATAIPSATPTITPSSTPTHAPTEEPLTGDAASGELIFTQGKNGAPMCLTCHQAPNAVYSVGPTLHGVAERTIARLGEENLYAYLHESIVNPGAHLVTGFRNVMYPQYDEQLTEQDIADIIAYLLTQ